MQCFQHFDFKPKYTSDHSGMHFLSLIDLSCALATLYFDTFGPSTATKHWKNSVFREFYAFSLALIFFRLTLSLLSLSRI